MNLVLDGFTLVRGLADAGQVAALLRHFGTTAEAGRRGLLADQLVHSFANSPMVLARMSERLGLPAKPVRAILFDKSAETNWLVPWHQDLTIAVGQRVEAAGFGPWSVKEGITHVQPPTAVLEQMLTLRLHLDDCDETNGPLEVIAGSHRFGKLSAEQIARRRTESVVTSCLAGAGDALLMRPLLLHASSRSTSTAHRRVLHIEYAACDLPAPLTWHSAA